MASYIPYMQCVSFDSASFAIVYLEIKTTEVTFSALITSVVFIFRIMKLNWWNPKKHTVCIVYARKKKEEKEVIV